MYENPNKSNILVFKMAGGQTTNINYVLVRKAIKEATSLTMREFVTDKLKDKYSSFMYRFRVGKLSLKEYHLICFYAGKPFEELWPNPHVPQARRISLKLNAQTLPPQPPPYIKQFFEDHPDALVRTKSMPATASDEYYTVSHNPSPGGDEGTQKKGQQTAGPAFVDPYEGISPQDL